tara:strand:- start:57 stop:296 length:240 start_codon:yes stop_codon:yes gene_type:complete
MRINVGVEGCESDWLQEEIQRIEGEGGVEVRFAKEVDRSQLGGASWGSIPWRESLEVFAKMNRLRITEPEVGVIVLTPE